MEKEDWTTTRPRVLPKAGEGGRGRVECQNRVTKSQCKKTSHAKKTTKNGRWNQGGELEVKERWGGKPSCARLQKVPKCESWLNLNVRVCCGNGRKTGCRGCAQPGRRKKEITLLMITWCLSTVDCGGGCGGCCSSLCHHAMRLDL